MQLQIPLNFKEKFKEILSIKESPERIALAFALGIFNAFSPLVGTKTILALSIAWIFKLNIIVVMAGTLVNNPWTITPIYGFNFLAGNFILQKITSHPVSLDWSTFSAKKIMAGTKDTLFALIQLRGKEVWLKIKFLILPFTLGSFLIGFLLAVISYFLLKQILERNLKLKQVANYEKTTQDINH